MAKEKKRNLSGILVPAGLLIGMGFDFLLNTRPSGLFIGLSCGIVAMFIAMIVVKN